MLFSHTLFLVQYVRLIFLIQSSSLLFIFIQPKFFLVQCSFLHDIHAPHIISYLCTNCIYFCTVLVYKIQYSQIFHHYNINIKASYTVQSAPVNYSYQMSECLKCQEVSLMLIDMSIVISQYI